ncbi:aminotransferase class I/II-fold pyridoxal phosphate-dependent enzyme [Streptomyces ovatisporus]|uniref:Aminotransferase n=1 Tax=Streptomyces ovatisporus TaxID=1128682 RepID=A0ABV9AE51_9ACTN
MHAEPPSTAAATARCRKPDVSGLRHHGDAELRDAGPGLTDLAVNVRAGTPPPWLKSRLAASLDSLAAYPDQRDARRAVAARHGVAEDQVLLTAGAAEAFVLLARALHSARPVVVHPQFTEPEAALADAGRNVRRVLLGTSDGFRLDPSAVPESADLVVVGNPTNPTSVLHPARVLSRLARPGRTLVVDEAFIDAVPGEAESLAPMLAGRGAPAHPASPEEASRDEEARDEAPREDEPREEDPREEDADPYAQPGQQVLPTRPLPGRLVVLRSLTKTWGLAGLRIGYVLSDAGTIADLARHQPLWPVSTPALTAAEACCEPAALAEAEAAARQIEADRARLLDRLREFAPAGLLVAGRPRAPFVLVRHPRAAALREELRTRGFALRRGDTFPGLGPQWLRIAVRDGECTDRLAAALADVLGHP